MDLTTVAVATFEKLVENARYFSDGPTRETYRSVLEIVRKLDPLKTEETFEDTKPAWYDMVENPQKVAEDSPTLFLEVLKNRTDFWNEETLQLWYDLDPQSLFVRIKEYKSFNCAPLNEIWAKHWPKDFARTCKFTRSTVLANCYDLWKEVDPKTHYKTIKSTNPDYLETVRANTDVLLRWLKDDPQHFTNFFLGTHSSFRTLALIDSKVFEAWSEVEPEAFLELTLRYRSDMLYHHGDTWAKVDKEGYLDACRSYPSQAIRDPQTLKSADESTFRELVERTLKWELQTPDEVLSRRDYVISCMLLYNWEEFSERVGTAFKFINTPTEWKKQPGAEPLKAFEGRQIGQLTDEQVAELLTYIKDNKITDYPEACLLASRERAAWGRTHVWSNEELDTWMAQDARSWVDGGILEIYQTFELVGEQDYIALGKVPPMGALESVTNLIKHYRTNKGTFREVILGSELNNGDLALELVPYILEPGEETQLVKSILETPGLGADAVSWATLRAGNLSGEQHVKAPVRLGRRPVRDAGLKVNER